MFSFPRLSVLMVTGICLAGCGGNDTTQPNSPAATQESQTSATLPSLNAWRTPTGSNPLTQPAAPASQPASPQVVLPTNLTDKKGVIHPADDALARQLIAQIYADLKAHKIDEAQATMVKIRRLRRERALSDPIRFIEIPDADNAIISAQATQVMGSPTTQPGR